MASDAYATGQALVALRQAGAMLQTLKTIHYRFKDALPERNQLPSEGARIEKEK